MAPSSPKLGALSGLSDLSDVLCSLSPLEGNLPGLACLHIIQGQSLSSATHLL